MINLLMRTVMMGTPLLFGATSEVIAERTGMMVTAIEGIFLMGAWAGFVGAYLSGSLAVGLLCAVLAGVAVAALYGWICIYLGQHQVVTGVAINILALGLSSFLYRVIFGVPVIPLTVEPLKRIAVPLLSGIPFVGPVLFNQNVLTYAIFVLAPLSWFVLYRTSLGLAIRSVGENPEAGDVAGIDVYRIRFLAVLFAGVMGGLAGAYYSIGFLGMFANNIIGGRGWIAFAICFLGNWNPKGAVIGTLAFGFAEAVAIYMQSIQINPMFPNELFIAIPYVLTIVLTVTRKSFNVPAKLGTAYLKEN